MTESLHLVCPLCAAINRLPVNRLQQSPKCGQCHQALFDGTPLPFNQSNFDTHLRHDEIPLLVDFWADWCGPCKIMSPAFAKAAPLLEPHFRLGKVNTETEVAISQRYNIRSIPTLIVFLRGKELARQSGALATQDIVRWARTVR